MKRSSLLSIFAMLALAASGIAQQITASITGTVRDAQGAVVPAATVQAINRETGFSRNASSGADGAFLIQYLPVGPYNVEVSAAGFSKFVQENIVLTVDQIQTVNVTLAVGNQVETVTVTGSAPLVNTSTAELGRTVQHDEITGLPLVNRNVYTEISLTPGVQSNSASSTSQTPNFTIGVPSTVVVVNGGIDAGVPMVSYYLDGGVNMTGLRNYGNQLPNPDALQEFRVETSDFSAQYGRMSGAVVTAVTNSGTNQLHGSLFEFVRNNNLNATPWGASINAPYHRNQFGGTVGGPVRKDKAFFFFSYGGLRQATGTFLSGGVVPTGPEREGDFSQSAVKPKDASGTPYPGGVIPSTALDPTAMKMLAQFVPTANGPNNRWSGWFSGPTDNDEVLAKFDQDLSDRNRLAVSYFTVKTTQNTPGGGNLLYSTQLSFARQQNVNASDTYSITPTTINQAWIGFTRVMGGRTNFPAEDISAFGSNFQIQGPSALPNVAISGYFTLGQSLAGPVSGSDFYSVRDTVGTTKGKHTLTYGFEASLDKDMFAGNLYNYGQFTFATSTPGSTGNALTDFLTGKVGTMEQDTPYHGLLSKWYFGFFVQDSYRVAPRFTINIGLRYDLETPPTEAQNLTATFVPGVQSTVVPSAPLGLLFPGDKGVSRGIADLRAKHFSPRLGLVWDPFGNGKTAVRLGGGIFYGSVSGNEWNQPANAQPFAVRQTFSSITSLTNVYGNPASFPNGSPFPYIYSPAHPRFLPAASVETISQDYQWPETYQMNAAVERQLPGQVSLTVAYVGTMSRHLPFTTDANYPAWAPGASTSQTSINNRRPFDPGVLGQVQYLESNQNSSYDSLQISVHRSLARNFMVNGFYVWSHSIWTASSAAVGIGGQTQDYASLWEERGPSDFDRRSMASISGLWKVQYYKGTSSLIKNLLNGWHIAPIVTLNSGAPFNILTGANNNDDSYGNNRPNVIAGVNPFLDPHRTRGAVAAAWFNTAAFTPNGPGKGIGIGGADGTTPRDYLRAPGYRDIDLGIFRDFVFRERFTLQVRGEASNVFNMVDLAAPTANLASSINGQISAAVANSNRQLQIGMRLTF
jgi:hypothetical protein